MAEETLFTEIINNLGKAKKEGKLKGGYRFSDDGKLSVGGGYYDKDKMLEVEIGKDGGNILFKKRFADGGITTPKRGLVDSPGSYAGLTIEQALSKIFKTQTTFRNRKELLNKLKALGLKNTSIKTLTPSNFPILRTVIYTDAYTKITEQMLEDSLGKEKLEEFRKKGVPEKTIKQKYTGKKSYKNLSDAEKEKRRKKNRANLKNNPDLVERDRIASAERSRARRRAEAKFYKVQKANSLVWNDFLRSAESENGLLKFSGNKPEPGKRYNKIETEKFVLVDKNGNKIRYDSLMSDVKKAGLNAERLFLPYRQKEYLAAEKVTQEINKELGYNKRGNNKSVWNVQHVEGIGKSLDNVQLTFGTENLAEAGSRRTFDAAWKTASALPQKTSEERKIRFGKMKAATKNYYKSLGPNIVAQIGKKPIGTAPALTELLSRVKDAKGNIITSPNINRVIADLNKSDKADLNRLVEKQIATVKRFAAKNGIQLNSFAGVVDLSQSGLTMPPAVKNALKTIVKYGGKTLRGVGKGAIVLDPIFAAADENRADRRGAGALDKTQYIGESFVQGLINLPTTLTGAGTFASDFLKGKRGEDLKFKSDILYTPKSFAEENLEENLKKTPIKKRARNLEFNMLSAGGYRDPKLADPEYQKLMESMSIKDIKDIIKKGDIKAKSYGIGTLPREVAKPTKYDIYYDPKKVYNN